MATKPARGVVVGKDGQPRCVWPGDDPDYLAYHDEEWGKPVYDDQQLFELLCLEGMQAGLSWITVLRKRENFRKAFAGFDPAVVARFTDDKLEELAQDAGIIRNRLKIASVITNAKAVLALAAAGQPFGEYLWRLGASDGQPKINHWQHSSEVPASTDQSTAMSKQLKKDGFKFVGPTIVYAFMQASGMVNDHLVGCFCHPGYSR